MFLRMYFFSSLGLVMGGLSGCEDLQQQAASVLEGAQESIAESTRAEPMDQEVSGSLDDTDHLMDFSRGQDQRYDRYQVPLSSGMVLVAEVSSEEFDPQIENPSSPVFRARRSPGPVHRDVYMRLDAPSDDAGYQANVSFDVMGNNASALGAYTLRYRTWYPDEVLLLPRRRAPDFATPDPLPTNAQAIEAGETEGALGEEDGMLTEASRVQIPNRPLRVNASGLFDAYAFEVEEGQQIRLRVQSRAIEPHIVMIAPDGFEIDNDDGRRSASVRTAAAQSGTYRVLVYDDTIGSYTLRLTLR